MQKPIAAAFCPFLATLAFAAPKTWDGGGTIANWNDAANWNPDGAPASADAVLLDNSIATPLPVIGALSGANCATLTVDGTLSGNFLNYGGATPLVTNLHGASVNAANTGPLLSIGPNAPASVTANKINFRLQTNGEFSAASGKTLTFSNCILSQNGTRKLTKTGAGTIAFSGTGSQASFTGGLDIAEGTWNASVDTLDLPTSGTIKFTNVSGTPAIITSTNSHSIEALDGGNYQAEIWVTGANGLTITGGSNTNFWGRIRGVTKLTHAGTGVLTLKNSNTFTGAANINSGTLALGPTGSIDNTPAILIGGGAIFDVSALAGGFTLGDGKSLSGVGAVTGALTAAGGAIISPGTGGTGTLTISNGLTLAAGSHLAIDINGPTDHDTLVVSAGNISLAGGLAPSLGYAPAIGDTFYIVRNNGAGTTTGTLSGAGDGGKLDIGGKWWRVSFTSDLGGAGFATAGGGNDVAIQRIDDPSPSAVTAIISGPADEQVVEISLAWQDNASTETGYKLYRVFGDGSMELLATLSADASSFTDTVSNFTDYTYAIQAFDASGDLGDPSFTTPLRVGSTFTERNDFLLDHLSTEVPNLGQFDSGPHRIGRTGFWCGEARLLRNDIATGLSYIATALEDASAENSNAGFSMWPGMDAYLRWGHLFSQTLKDRYQEVYTTSDLYDNSATPNQRFMISTASYLANSVWGASVNSVSTAANGTSDPTGKAYLENTINNVPFRGYPEHNSTQYLIYTLAPMQSLAEFAPDPAFRNKARMAFDWGMAEAASAMQNGRWSTPVTRGRVSDTQNGYSNTTFAWWLLYGGPTPANMLDSTNITVLAMPTFPGVPPELNTAAAERSQSFTRRTFATRSAGPQIAYFKQTWMTPRYALCSQVEGTVSGFNADGSIILSNLNTTAIQDGYQGQRWSLGWDDPPGADSCLRITTPTTYSGTTGGISIYEDTLQHEDAMIAVYNIPATGGTGGNNGDFPNQWLSGHIPATYLAISDEAATTGRIFLHYNSVLVAVSLTNTFSWSTDFTTPCSKAGLAIETAPVSEFPQATPAERLAAFRTAVLANAPDAGAINDAAPRFIYTNRHGHVLDLTYGLAGKIDGVTVDYQSWPMLDDPWVHQSQQGLLHIFGRDRTLVKNYFNWTETINHRPTRLSAPVPETSAPVDIDLTNRVNDAETPANQLHFSVSNPANGSVELLTDGRTARFTPSSAGPASFDFTASDRGIHPQLVWHYDFEPPASLATGTIPDAAGTNRGATAQSLGSGTASLDADVPAALASNSTRGMRFNESGTDAFRLTRTVSRSNLEMSNGSWTFSTWFKRDTNSTDDFIFYLGGGDGFSGGGDELYLYCPANTATLRLSHYSATNVRDIDLTSSATASPGQWHHAALTFEKSTDNSGTVRLYLDGLPSGTLPVANWALQQDTKSVILGGHHSTTSSVVSRYLDGWLDDCALFRGALPAGQIASLARQSVATFGGLTRQGTVALTVTPGSAWESWQNAHFTSEDLAEPSISGPQADKDRDGIANLLEFVLNGDPSVAGTSILPTLNITSTDYEFTFQRRDDSLHPETTLTFQYGGDLSDWTDVVIPASSGPVGAATISVTDGSPADTVKVSIPKTEATVGKFFGRLKVLK